MKEQKREYILRKYGTAIDSIHQVIVDEKFAARLLGKPRGQEKWYKKLAPTHIHQEKTFDAIREHDLDAVKVLIKDRYVHYKDENEQTLLHVAVSVNDKDIVQYMLKTAISLNDQDKNQDTALHLAVENGNLEICQILLKENDADISLKNKAGETPFLVAVRKNNEAIKEVLKNFNEKMKARTARACL